MTKDINTLLSDIESLLDGRSALDHLGDFSTGLNQELSKRFEEYLTERKPRLSLSQIGVPLRKLWYTLKGYKQESLIAATKVKFLYGAICEHLLLFLVKEAGHKVEDNQLELELDGVPGHNDCTIDNWLIDIKSASSYGFKKFKDRSIIKDDSFGYLPQISAYTQCLLDKGRQLEGAGLLAINKESGEICLCLFTLEEILAYAPRERIKSIKENLKKDTPPKRCYSHLPLSKKAPDGPTILNIGCVYCPFKETCWSDANEGRGLIKASYSYGDKYFTDIKDYKFRVTTKASNEDEFPTRED